MKPSTQRVLGMLQSAGPKGVTSGEFCAAYILALGRRIDEIRKAGFTVTAHRVANPDSQQRRYVLG